LPADVQLRNHVYHIPGTAMKTILLSMCMLFSGAALAQQEETLLGSRSIESGGYGALVVKFTPVNDRFGVLVGARGGWIINHSFALGLAGYGLANKVPAHQSGPFGQRYVDMGYGGLDLEVIVDSDALIHWSAHTLIGAGAVNYRTWTGTSVDWSWGSDWDHRGDAFFVVEPGVNVDVNVTTWFRFSVGGAYRFVSGVASDVSNNADLSGASGMISFRFGSF
jgi:hypothetical protein